MCCKSFDDHRRRITAYGCQNGTITAVTVNAERKGRRQFNWQKRSNNNCNTETCDLLLWKFFSVRNCEEVEHTARWTDHMLEIVRTQHTGPHALICESRWEQNGRHWRAVGQYFWWKTGLHLNLPSKEVCIMELLAPFSYRSRRRRCRRWRPWLEPHCRKRVRAYGCVQVNVCRKQTASPGLAAVWNSGSLVALCRVWSASCNLRGAEKKNNVGSFSLSEVVWNIQNCKNKKDEKGCKKFWWKHFLHKNKSFLFFFFFFFFARKERDGGTTRRAKCGHARVVVVVVVV